MLGRGRRRGGRDAEKAVGGSGVDGEKGCGDGGSEDMQ